MDIGKISRGIAFSVSACAFWAGTAWAGGSVEVVQSVPVETTLAVPGIRQTQEVWLEMIRVAKDSLDIEQFYISNKAGEALEPVLQAIEAAAGRGVKVRLAVDKSYYETYPESVDRLAKSSNTKVRKIDAFSSQGGVQHAKFMIVDQKQVFMGSQNFDWRALNHIHEVGLRMDDAKVVGAFLQIFEKDWNSASTQSSLNGGGQSEAITVLASPLKNNPAGIGSSLSAITGLMDSAQKSLQIEVMDYSTKASAAPWTALDDSIRKAASRGARVQLLVDAAAAKRSIKALQSLAALKNIEIRAVTIPAWSGGPIDYARLIHSKFMLVDGSATWLGTENWVENYFNKARNVGAVLRMPEVTQALGKVFDQVWNSKYAETIQPQTN